MLLNFTKMNGAGNDFILADNRQKNLHLSEKQIVKLCDRHQGVGADGLMLLVPCDSGKADWAWQFYNNDGSVADMCGNGARCFARFIQKTTGNKNPLTFETGAGVIRAEFHGEQVTVNLTAPKDLRLDEKVTLSTGVESINSLNTGVPHAVLFVPDADKAMVQKLGEEVRYHSHFTPKGTNVNFVQKLPDGRIRVRTYERGIEGETLACGTGVTASALISAVVHSFQSPVKIQVQSGDSLEVSFTRNGQQFEDVRLTGPADFTFQGTVEI
jgi:diaminopimelate epimerase